MSVVASNFYADWRVSSGIVSALHEGNEPPPERLLQAIWFHQRLCRDRLQTLDGQPVRILHPGFWNREPGPDFRQAMVQFGQSPPVSGDIEVDLRDSDWTSHQHDQNPAFRQVVLHVIWDGEARRQKPALRLKSCLDSPLSELSIWLQSDAIREFPEVLQGQCCQPLTELPDERVTELLRQAALVRLQSKAALFQARARQAGWEQSLWEGLFRALGYKHNAWPMQRLAELIQAATPSSQSTSLLAWQARLLGLGGLLPTELNRSSSGYVRKLWDIWWRERESFSEVTLPPKLWRMSGLRPANHPQRRLAVAAHWLHHGGLSRKLEEWGLRKLKDSELAPTLHQEFSLGKDDYWSNHWTLKSPRLPESHPLIGTTRSTDLAINVVLPWLWIRATEGRNELLQREMEHRYLAWPAAEDNAVLKLARQRLLGTRRKASLRGAAVQQGVLQVVRDFCEHSNAVCGNCKFPQLVQNWHSR